MKRFLALCILAFLFFRTLQASVIHVPADQPTIQSGINTASAGDTVLVQPGTYKENISFNGKNIIVGSLFITTGDPFYISQTVIDGSQITSVVNFVNGEGSSAVLSGFTITNGNGGITCRYRSSPTLTNLVVTGNSAAHSGGGIYCGDDSSPRLENVTISANTSGGSGGGMQCARRSNPTLVRVTISGNSAQRGGGGILCYESSPRLVNVTISGNSAYGGGAILCLESRVSLVNTILWNNSPEEIHFSEYSFSNSVTIAYCDLEGGQSAIVTNNKGVVYYLEGNVDSDPLFANPAGGDFHLQEGSPCIDVGTAFFVWGSDTLVHLPGSDYEGSAPDIGAHEHGTVVLVDKAVSTPTGISLLQNYPNPFNPSTTIQYDLPEPEFVTLAVYDMLGREVAVLVQEDKKAGRHVVKFNAEGLASGIYVYRMQASTSSRQAGRFVETKKLLLLR